MTGLVSSRLLIVASLIPLVTILGAFMYMVVEGWSFSDGLYMTAITIATIGYGETNPLTPVGRSFTIGLIAVCFVVTTASSAILTSFIVENDLSGAFVKRRVLKMISKLSGHTIVCGAGRMGLAVVEMLLSHRRPVVVIDSDKAALDIVRRRFREALVVQGSATDEACLADANVLAASDVVVALPSELDNLLVAITCKDIGPRLRVFARSDDPVIANRMRKSGVDEVLSPSMLMGNCIADKIVEGPQATKQSSVLQSLFSDDDSDEAIPTGGRATRAMADIE